MFDFKKRMVLKLCWDHHWFTINLNDPPKLLQCWWKMYNSQNQVYAATTQYFIQSTIQWDATLPWDIALAHDIFCICVYYGHITLFYFLQVYGSNSLLQWFWNLHLYNHWLSMCDLHSRQPLAPLWEMINGFLGTTSFSTLNFNCQCRVLPIIDRSFMTEVKKSEVCNE